MSYAAKCAIIIGAAVIAAMPVAGMAQSPGPQPGYFDIPPGFDFPANKQTLEQYRVTANVPAQRTHVWNVFAGMTQPTPDGKYAIFETWYSLSEAFATGPSPEAVGPRRVVPRFQVPRQFGGLPGQPAPEAAGTALLSEVMFNYANYHFIRDNKLYLNTQLATFQQSGAADPKIPNNRIIPSFPADSVSLKTVWWPVAKSTPTPMPVWDPEANPMLPGGNDFSTWKRVVAIDPTRTNIPPDATMTISFLNAPRPDSHVVGLDRFHYVTLDAQTVANAMANPRLEKFVQQVLGRPLQAGDYAVFAGTHLTTKEIDDWVWATFWWHDRPDAGPFAADRPAGVKDVWRNYLMSATFDLNLPREPDNTPHITFNPWLEAHFRQGIVSNCMNCHNRASYPPLNFLPIYRGDPDLQNDPTYAAGRLRTDFLWSVPFEAQ